MNNINFKNITEFNKAQNLPEPENPLFSIGHKKLGPDEIEKCNPSNDEISYTNHFYVISFKNIISGEIIYGRTKYDCSAGTLLFTAPGQTIKAKNIVISSESWFLAFHEDFIRGLDIRKRIKNYNFFNYNVNEALHLSPQEEKIIKSILTNIEAEYYTNQDEFSKELILSLLDTLLKYANRFYKRQFLDRKELSGDIYSQFYDYLTDYVDKFNLEEYGIPKIEAIASHLSVSARYLSDTLKAETGKTAIDHINLFMIEEAKDLLLKTNMTIAETAYQLGFEYPQYFSRLFKKKTGMSPKEYQKSFAQN